MASGSDIISRGFGRVRSWLSASVRWHAPKSTAVATHPRRTHELVSHSRNDELVEEGAGEPTELGNREAALLGYIESRKV
ncbi:MAG: hypothetical protein ACXV8L_02780 [Ilumatobacteraceae bacterium]